MFVSGLAAFLAPSPGPPAVQPQQRRRRDAPKITRLATRSVCAPRRSSNFNTQQQLEHRYTMPTSPIPSSAARSIPSPPMRSTTLPQSHVCVAFKIPNYTVNVIPCHHIEMSGSTQPRRRHRAKTHCSTHAPAMPPPRSRRSVTPSTTARHTTSSGNNALFNHESTPWRELTRKIMT